MYRSAFARIYAHFTGLPVCAKSVQSIRLALRGATQVNRASPNTGIFLFMRFVHHFRFSTELSHEELFGKVFQILGYNDICFAR